VLALSALEAGTQHTAYNLSVFEAVFQFHLYLYLVSFFRGYDVRVLPEFPTRNGEIDLLIRYAEQLFGLELKSFANQLSRQKFAEQTFASKAISKPSNRQPNMGKS